MRPASAPGRGDGGFCGGYERTNVIAAGRRCMGDPIRHKLEGDLSDVGDAPLLGRRECPDGDLCHRLLLPRPPGEALQPAWITRDRARRGPGRAAAHPVALERRLPLGSRARPARGTGCARVRFGDREADLASVALEGVVAAGRRHRAAAARDGASRASRAARFRSRSRPAAA